MQKFQLWQTYQKQNKINWYTWLQNKKICLWKKSNKKYDTYVCFCSSVLAGFQLFCVLLISNEEGRIFRWERRRFLGIVCLQRFRKSMFFQSNKTAEEKRNCFYRYSRGKHSIKLEGHVRNAGCDLWLIINKFENKIRKNIL